MSVHLDHIVTMGQLARFCRDRPASEPVMIQVDVHRDSFSGKAARAGKHANVILGVLLMAGGKEIGCRLYATDPEDFS